MDKSEWASAATITGTILLLIVMALVGITTMNINDRDREQACNMAGGQIVKDVAPGLEEGCYKVVVQYEVIPTDAWR